MEHLDKNECVYKLSSSVKTNRGVGKIAMTQKRLFLLTEGRPGYVEIATFRNIEVRRSWRQMQPVPRPPGVLWHLLHNGPFVAQLAQLILHTHTHTLFLRQDADTQPGFEFAVFLPRPPEHWGYRYVLSCLAIFIFFNLN
jgi:hypothetical protein